MDLLFNPWVIIMVVLCVIIGNIAALKYTSKIKLDQWSKKAPPTSKEPKTTTSSTLSSQREKNVNKKER